MAITKVADGQAAAASITLASVGIVAGDLVVIHAYRNASITVPSSPGANWTDISATAGANTNSRRIGYRVIQSGDNLATISGTWTNATAIQFIALRGQHLTTPIGTVATPGGTNTSTLTTPVITTFAVTDGTSWVIALAGSKATNANSVTLSSSTDEVSSQGALNLATGRAISSWASRNYSATVNASANRMDAIEIEAAPPIAASFTANATILKSQSPTFTADAVLLKTAASTLAADAVLAVIRSATFTADAVINRESTSSLTANAVTLKGQTASAAANAIVLQPRSATFTGNAILRAATSAAIPANAVQLKTATAGYSADAVLLRGRLNGYTADAALLSPRASSLTANAFISGGAGFIFFDAEATIQSEQTASLTTDAFIAATQFTAFTTDALVFGVQSRTLTTDAVLSTFIVHQTAFTADAWIALLHFDYVAVVMTAPSILGTMTTEATQRRVAFTADAVMEGP